MSKLLWTLLIGMGVAFIGCQKEGEEAVPPIEVVPTYTPPSDGKIKPEQADFYIRAAKLLNEKVLIQEKAIHSLVKTHNLSDDLRELNDSLYIKENPEVKQKYEKLYKESQENLEMVYSEVGISEEEFTWIGGALADPVNEEIQKKVEKAMAPTEEGGK